MDKNQIIILCFTVIALGFSLTVAIVWLGWNIFKNSQYDYWGLEKFIDFWESQKIRPNLPRYFVDTFTESMQRRNEFWMTYGQILVSIPIIVILTVLLLTKTISAEAGLPLLSAVTGFAIAKGVNSNNRPSPPPLDRDQS